jgi:hypothetical protein
MVFIYQYQFIPHLPPLDEPEPRSAKEPPRSFVVSHRWNINMAGELESDVIGSDRLPPANSKGLDYISLHVAEITRGRDYTWQRLHVA